LKFDAPVIGTVSVPVAHEGELPMVHLPSVGIDSASFKKLSLTGADIALKLKVTNPNAFNLLLNKMTYTLGVNGATWASGTTTKPVAVKEKGDSIIEIPVSLNLLAMKNVYTLLTSDEPLKYDLKSSLDLGTSNPLMKQITLPLSRKGEFKIPR
jgi:LEA14-like dessication related protein